MKMLSINALLCDCIDTSIPSEVDIESKVQPMAFRLDAPENALLFLTEKVGENEKDIDLSIISSSPPFAIVTSKTRRVTSSPCPIIRVNNVRIAFAYALYRLHRIDCKRMKFIGITGTNGKTTTATLIYEMLRNCGYKAGFIGTGKILSDDMILNNDTYSMTTPDPNVLYPALEKMQNDGCEYIVMEVSSHSLALGKVAPIEFEYAIFTNLDSDHLDFHKSKEDYFLTKTKLFSQSRKGLFNIDDEYGRRAYENATCDKRTFGIIERGDAFATEIDIASINESSFFYREKNLIFKASLKLTGAFNVYNTIAALKCVIDLGIKPCVAKYALEKIEGVSGRMEIIKGSITAVIDYAHTPSAFYNCLKTLKSILNTKQRLFVVFGCGGNRDASKRSVFGNYADLLADEIIITEDNSRSEAFEAIAAEIASGIKSTEYKIIKDRENAIKYAFRSARPNDVIAVIGKGHEKYKIIQNTYIPFDEKKIILDSMREAEAKK